jgi:hypothetical protein
MDLFNKSSYVLSKNITFQRASNFTRILEFCLSQAQFTFVKSAKTAIVS